MLVRGRLVVKLPAPRVDALVAAGEGVRFDANKGVAMKEWFTLDAASAADWSRLCAEALAFAGAHQLKPARRAVRRSAPGADA